VSAEQWFIDEHKVSGLTLVVVAVESSQVGRCRAAMSGLTRLPRRKGQPLHFTKELDATRSSAYRTIAALPIAARLVTVPAGVPYVMARERAVRWVARRAVESQPQRLVFELDEAAVAADRRWLRSELTSHPRIEYLHLGKSEPMLWIADGIAWAAQRGGVWLPMIEHLIIERADA